jgi:hypothetical protein
VLLGRDGRCLLAIYNLPSAELFRLYDAEIALRLRNPRNPSDTRCMLSHFHEFLGEFPPTEQLAKYANHKTRTLYRHFMMLKPFMKWYRDPTDDIKIRIPKSLAPTTREADVDALIYMSSRPNAPVKTP